MTTLTTRTGGKAPCGFCGTGHHGLCPGSIRNGSKAASGPIWECPCALAGHTLGGAHRESSVERLPRNTIIRPLVMPVEPAAAVAPTEPSPVPAGRSVTAKAGKAKGKKADPFPAGVIAPVAFRHLLVGEGLAPSSFRPQTVYTWVTKAAKGGSFPVKHYGPDGSVHDQPQPDTRPGVLVDQARGWYQEQAKA